MIMKHLVNIDPAINSALIVMVLAIGVTIQIIEALITAIDNITWMVNSKTWHAGTLPSIRKENTFVILSNRIYQKHTARVAENK